MLNTPQEDVVLSVEGLPGFGTFSGDMLVFKPDADSPRETTVTVRATAGTAVDSTRFTVKVLPLFPKPPACNDSVEADAPLPVKGERQWRRVPSNTCYELFGVWGSSATDVWAVGARGTIIHWDGKAWTPFSSPTHRDLRAVSGSGPTDVIAVGGKEGDALPTIIHWNGFTREGYQGEVSSTSNLFGAWVATQEDVWAVGEVPVIVNGTASFAGFIARRNAQGWTSEQRTQWPRFRAVWGASAGDIWAVGLSGLAHWDGTAWTPLLGHTLTSNAIWGTGATDAWRVGPGGQVMHLESAR